jgi:uncharacterized protein (DUF302 family)
MYEEVEQKVLTRYGPNETSETLRNEVAQILHLNIRKQLPQSIIFNIGSFPFKTYLLDADVDLTILWGPVSSEMELSLLHVILQ